MPLKLHPERNRISSQYVHGLLFGKTVNRRTVVKFKDGQVTRQVTAVE